MKKIHIIAILLLIVISGLFYKNIFLPGNNGSIKDDSNKLSDNKVIENDKINKNSSNTELEFNQIKAVPDKYLKYDTLSGFIADVSDKIDKSKNIDIKNENFVICQPSESGGKIYTDINNDKLKAGYYNTKERRYDYMNMIDNAIDSNCIYGGKGSNATSKAISVDFKHEFQDQINSIFNKNTNMEEIIDEMEKVNNMTEKHNEFLSYLYDLKGEYNKANTLRDEKLDKNKKTKVTISGNIKDGDGNNLEGVKITLLNDDSKSVLTEKNGDYKFTFDSYPLSHLRIRATKEGYADGYYSIYLDHSKLPSLDLNETEDMVLKSADDYILVDFKNYDKIKDVLGKKYFIVNSSQSEYFVPIDGLYYANGKKFNGNKVKVYLYELSKWDNVENLVEVDTFDPVAGYVGDLMKTFGMPYIQFIDMDGKELFVTKQEPMILKNNIYHMKELYENYDQIYEAVTTGDMEHLVEKSKEGGYPITYDRLIKNDFLRWPVWWYLDRKKGTWISVPHKVTDISGSVQLKFYQVDGF